MQSRDQAGGPWLGDELLDPDPMVQFGRWFAEAGTDEMALATASPGGAPSCRMVLLKGFDGEGFVFYTNYRSNKGRQMEENPRAALLFRWPPRRQVRASGAVAKVPRATTQRYWDTRDRQSQLSAWASPQSRPVGSRRRLEDEVRAVAERFAGRSVPCPPEWGGYLVIPDELEFWLQGEHRLHDRIRYTRLLDGLAPVSAWEWHRIAP